MSEETGFGSAESIPTPLHSNIDVQKMLSESKIEAENNLPQGLIIRLQKLANEFYLAEPGERQKLLLNAIREHTDDEQGYVLSGIATHLAQRASNARKGESRG
ncbi:MAG: hypothetical protein AAB927_00555 [Patescibacteria group bacterium]